MMKKNRISNILLIKSRKEIFVTLRHRYSWKIIILIGSKFLDYVVMDKVSSNLCYI